MKQDEFELRKKLVKLTHDYRMKQIEAEREARMDVENLKFKNIVAARQMGGRR